MNVLFDTCILLDYLLKRKEFIKYSEPCVFSVVDGTINGYITVKSLMDIHYIIKKYLHNESRTREVIEIILENFILTDSSSSDAIKALNSKLNDYEDALMDETAKSIKVDCIVTRNIKDYKNSSNTIVSPQQLLSMITA